MAIETTTLAGGCFWCLEAVYDQLKGVQSVESGYAGGNVQNPSYKAVCTGTTGHAEVVQIAFDNDVISFQDILDVFFTIHDPTTLNRQGNDVGTQYRSAVFYHSDEQKEIAEKTIKDLNQNGPWDNPIVTQIVPVANYFPAEDYHQEYFENNPDQGYCRVIIAPKVAKFRSKYIERLKA
ncbi:MAG: peptide-methionine (S)-S-oxide reductase MsrA [Anaerolineae bacterium]|nr:peptide-methionine (S)-S-oxide reductase MsrA [Anaerolineae bacterium]MCA9894980.1 peptide-methionine (S)-S-oxide reductase MsrA [Anaerolineae bacterium]